MLRCVKNNNCCCFDNRAAAVVVVVAAVAAVAIVVAVVVDVDFCFDIVYSHDKHLDEKRKTQQAQNF